jgi:hypothetical protein
LVMECVGEWLSVKGGADLSDRQGRGWGGLDQGGGVTRIGKPGGDEGEAGGNKRMRGKGGK